MNLCLMRHGLAVERGARGFEDDAHRPLTPKGRRLLRKISAAFHALEPDFDVILFSPLVRAHQTAEIVAKQLKLQNRLVISTELSPDGSVKKLVEKSAP